MGQPENKFITTYDIYQFNPCPLRSEIFSMEGRDIFA
jgi:hypothetical protein